MIKKVRKIYYEGVLDCVVTRGIGYDINGEKYIRFYAPHTCPACGGYKEHPCSLPDFIDVAGVRLYRFNLNIPAYASEFDVDIYLDGLQRSAEEAIEEACEKARELPDVYIIER